ncbi:MAG: cytosolic protein, partial [Chloroflexi bacterium]|nr:cytosolic protein [Chloroflexota bacterium]
IAREMRALGIAGSWLNVTEDGKVTEATRQCLEIIAKHDMVLATSHIRPSEVTPVVRAAKEAGVQRIVITHPEFPTTLLSIDHQQQLAREGVYFERCFTTPNTGKISWDQVYANIREVGPDSTILATDLGQVTAPYPDEGLGIFAGNLLDNGFSESDVRKMVRDNAAQLLGARATAGVNGR